MIVTIVMQVKEIWGIDTYFPVAVFSDVMKAQEFMRTSFGKHVMKQMNVRD